MDNKAILIFGYGNPSRGDDALGPAFMEALQKRLPDQGASIDWLTDYQLQIEHALDLLGRELVLFVDAAVSGPEPFSLRPLRPDPELCYTTHAMSPGAVLAVYQQTQSAPLPPCYLLGIRGYEFDELGASLSPKARDNLDAAVTDILQRLETRTPDNFSAN